MRRLAVLFCAAFLLSTVGGCIVHTDNHRGRRRHHAKKSRKCHPSQRWNGHRCIHKGRGKGARKHDGRRR